MGKKENGERISIIVIFVLFSIFSLCMSCFRGLYSFTLYPDEFGYWASAAGMLGYDFSEVSSIGSYYSYGYSLILVPIMLAFKDSVIAYRAAVIVNLILQAVSFFLIKKVLDRFLDESDDFLKYLLSGMAVLYPSWVFYTQTTMSEALLFFMYVVTALLMFRFIDSPTVTGALLLSFAAIYMYTVHMRAVGALAAVFISVSLELFFSVKRADGKGKEYILVLVLLVLGFFFCLYLKSNVIMELFSGGQENEVYLNDYSGQTGKLIELLSLMGIGRFLVSMTGKILYLGCASFGCAYVGIWALIKKVKRGNRKSLYLLIASFLEFMVMCVYLMHSADLAFDRYDLFLHGRYFDFAIPLMGIIGFYELLKEGGGLRKILISLGIVLLSGVAAIVVLLLNRTGMADPHGVLMIGMSYFLDEDNFRPVTVILLSMFMTVVIAAVMILLIKFYNKTNNVYLFLFAHLLLIVLSYHACSRYIYTSQVYIHGDVMLADRIKELKDEGHDGDVVLLYEGGMEYIDTVQMRLRDMHIRVRYADGVNAASKDVLKSMTKDNELVLVDFESPLREPLSEMYDDNWEAGHFVLYFNDNGN